MTGPFGACAQRPRPARAGPAGRLHGVPPPRLRPRPPRRRRLRCPRPGAPALCGARGGGPRAAQRPFPYSLMATPPAGDRLGSGAVAGLSPGPLRCALRVCASRAASPGPYGPGPAQGHAAAVPAPAAADFGPSRRAVRVGRTRTEKAGRRILPTGPGRRRLHMVQPYHGPTICGCVAVCAVTAATAICLLDPDIPFPARTGPGGLAVGVAEDR